jgi:hypothetical protein
MTADIPALRAKARTAFPAGHPVRTLLDNLPDALTSEQLAAIGPSIMALAATPADQGA